MTPLAFAPFSIYPLAVLTAAGLFILWRDQSRRAHVWTGLAYGGAMFLAGTYWTYISVHIFGQAPVALAVFIMLALVVLMSLYFGLLGYVAHRWLPRRGPVLWLVGLPAAWVLAEWLRGWVATGFPWLSLGYSQIDSPLAGLAPVAGVYGLSWAVAVIAGAAVTLVFGSLRERLTAGVAALAAVLGSWGLGLISWTAPNGETVTASVVQGAVSQDLKWLPEQREPTKALYRELTRRALGSDVVVWPEAAIPVLLHEMDGYLDEIRALGLSSNTAIVLGMLEWDFEKDELRNGVISLGPADEKYYKRHLVPFGEYFPVPDFIREWMRLMSLPYRDSTPGADDQPPLNVAGLKVAVTICYEDSYGAEQIGSFPEATLMINVSNDAWFGDSIAPHQHLQIARMRSLEAGRFQLRATNTGISAIIGPDGAVEGVSPQFESDVLTRTVHARVGATPYVRAGDWPVLILCAALLGAAVPMRRRTG